ncbi:MAG: LysE family transporter [Bacteroidota bacterium]
MFFKGVGIGLGLALLVGPLIVLLLQLALREGQQAAWTAGIGIWSSDLMYVLLAHFGTDQLRLAIDWPGFEPLVGIVGGLILIGVGSGLYFRRSKYRTESGFLPDDHKTNFSDDAGEEGVAFVKLKQYKRTAQNDDVSTYQTSSPHASRTTLLSAFWQGFAINTFNPFPVIFWSTVALTLVHDEGLEGGQAFALYAGILSTIVLSDSAKIWSAKWLREKLASGWLDRVGQIGGALLVVFGLVLIVRVWV